MIHPRVVRGETRTDEFCKKKVLYFYNTLALIDGKRIRLEFIRPTAEDFLRDLAISEWLDLQASLLSSTEKPE
jgi:hypothetical protein